MERIVNSMEMKKLFSFATFALFAATMLITSCKKEEDGNVFRLKIQPFESNDKTSLGEGGVTNWVQGDLIFVNGITRNTQAIQVRVDNGNATANVDINPTDDGRYYFFYPGLGTYATTNSENSTTKFFFNFNPYSNASSTGITYNANQLKAPMAGVSNGQEVVFSNIFSMLELVFPYEIGKFSQSNTNHIITITSESTPISGLFSVEYTENGWNVNFISATGGIPNSRVYKVQITENVSKVYLPIPAGQHKLTFEGNCFKREMRNSYNFEKNKIYTIDFSTMPKTFSVASNKKVEFATSNLQLTSTGYQFAINPESYCWVSGSNTTTNVNDLFFQNYTHNSIPSIETSTINVNGNEWAVPSSDEWQYLLGAFGSTNANNSYRKNYNYLCQRATINGVNGIVIMPDNCVLPAGWKGQIHSQGYSDITSLWPALSTQGAIFLPASGYLQYTISNSTLNCNNTSGTLGRYACVDDDKCLNFNGAVTGTTAKINPKQTGSNNTTKYAVAFRLYKEVQ